MVNSGAISDNDAPLDCIAIQASTADELGTTLPIIYNHLGNACGGSDTPLTNKNGIDNHNSHKIELSRLRKSAPTLCAKNITANKYGKITATHRHQGARIG